MWTWTDLWINLNKAIAELMGLNDIDTNSINNECS